MESGGSESENTMTHFVFQTQSLSSSSDTRGKHRLHAELKKLEQEKKFLEEELEKLERMDKSSASCKETLTSVQTRPDPLLSSTVAPLNPLWDRWFEGPRDSQGCRCCIL
ncbi:Guanine nucleotide-binding protein subunit gamma 2 [Trifolium repens]|nr:guanine nucleotide-binding protein subunit gamma [Trifolium repens]WJX18986.1 Guanine nucleotide-binding protein subunit gamma 2 [Trifolium repens]